MYILEFAVYLCINIYYPMFYNEKNKKWPQEAHNGKRAG